jgi:hypothetical protein
MPAPKAHVGRLALDEPPNLPEGEVVELDPVDGVLAQGGGSSQRRSHHHRYFVIEPEMVLVVGVWSTSRGHGPKPWSPLASKGAAPERAALQLASYGEGALA